MREHPIPVPTNTSLVAWAGKLVNYLRVIEREIENPAPKSVQLEYRKANAKATTDGLLMWCPITGTVIVSKAGEWYPIELGAAVPIVGIKHNV